jgi:hypothetical protein
MDDLRLRHWYRIFKQNLRAVEGRSWASLPPEEQWEVAFRAGWLAHTLAELVDGSPDVEAALRDEAADA